MDCLQEVSLKFIAATDWFQVACMQREFKRLSVFFSLLATVKTLLLTMYPLYLLTVYSIISMPPIN